MLCTIGLAERLINYSYRNRPFWKCFGPMQNFVACTKSCNPEWICFKQRFNHYPVLRLDDPARIYDAAFGSQRSKPATRMTGLC